MMTWFRVYSEIKDDPKMLELDDHEFRLWVGLLCLANENAIRGRITGTRMRGLAAALRTDEERLQKALALFAELGMIDAADLADGVVITKWMNRQYDKPSDTPAATAERKRRSRARRADVTPSHALYADSDADQIQKENTVESPGNALSRCPSGLQNAFTKVLGVEPRTASECDKWRTGLDELHSAGVSEGDIAALVTRFRAKFGLDIPCHPASLARNLSALRQIEAALPPLPQQRYTDYTPVWKP